MQASILWSFTTDERRDAGESVQVREGRLLGFVLGQPLLAPALGFTFLVLSLEARLFVEPTALELPEQPFARQLFLGDLQGLLDVVVKNLDFHAANPRPPPHNSGVESNTELCKSASLGGVLICAAPTDQGDFFNDAESLSLGD